MAGRIRAAAADVSGGIKSAASNRSGVAVFIYVVAGLIIVYLLLSRQSKLPGAIGKGTTGFATLWGALTGTRKS